MDSSDVILFRHEDNSTANQRKLLQKKKKEKKIGGHMIETSRIAKYSNSNEKEASFHTRIEPIDVWSQSNF